MKKVLGGLTILVILGLVLAGCAAPTNGTASAAGYSYRSLADGKLDDWDVVRKQSATGNGDEFSNNWFMVSTFGGAYTMTPKTIWVPCDCECNGDDVYEYNGGSDSATAFGKIIDGGSNSWFMYNQYKGKGFEKDIVAGNPKNNKKVVGTMIVSNPIDKKVTVTIVVDPQKAQASGGYKFWVGDSALQPPKSPGQFDKDSDPRFVAGQSGSSTTFEFDWPAKTKEGKTTSCVNLAIHLSVNNVSKVTKGNGDVCPHGGGSYQVIPGEYDLVPLAQSVEIVAGQKYYAGDIEFELGLDEYGKLDGTFIVTFVTPYYDHGSYSLGIYKSLTDPAWPNPKHSPGSQNYNKAIKQDPETGYYYARVSFSDFYDPIEDPYEYELCDDGVYRGPSLFVYGHVSFDDKDL